GRRQNSLRALFSPWRLRLNFANRPEDRLTSAVHPAFVGSPSRSRQRQARGRVIIVRYADDFVMGFQRTQDARRMLADLRGDWRSLSGVSTGRKARGANSVGV